MRRERLKLMRKFVVNRKKINLKKICDTVIVDLC